MVGRRDKTPWVQHYFLPSFKKKALALHAKRRSTGTIQSNRFWQFCGQFSERSSPAPWGAYVGEELLYIERVVIWPIWH